MEQFKDTAYYKGYKQGYQDGYQDGLKDSKTGKHIESQENGIAQIPIEAMEITTRAYNCLTRMGCRSVSDLLSLNNKDLQTARRLGIKTAMEIAHWLDSNGFHHTAWSRYM